MSFDVQWISHGRKAKCKPDPAYPDGKHNDIAAPGVPSCVVEVPYPAPECGIWYARCKACGFRVGITAAGRPDDPRSARVPCQLERFGHA